MYKEIKEEKQCTHPSSSHIYISQGKEYEHTCPACKEKQTLTPSQIKF